MGLEQYQTYPAVDRLMACIDQFNLHHHVVDLQAYGLTIVPPETMRIADDFIDRLRGAILRVCEQRNQVDLGNYLDTPTAPRLTHRNSWDLLEEDDVFVEAAINPVNLTLVRWLLGQSAVFSGQTWIIKGPGAPGLGLHSDAHGIPPGAGQIAHMCNASWICTDYESIADGPTVFVPGSHHYARATLPHETDVENTAFKVVPLLAKAGSLAIWNGATWHAAKPRTREGLRITLVQNYMRSYMRVQRDYEDIDPKLLRKYPALSEIIGQALYPYSDPKNPDQSRVAPFMHTGTDPYA